MVRSYLYVRSRQSIGITRNFFISDLRGGVVRGRRTLRQCAAVSPRAEYNGDSSVQANNGQDFTRPENLLEVSVPMIKDWLQQELEWDQRHAG